MKKLGYIPGKGFGKDQNGRVKSYIPPPHVGKESLGYDWDTDIPPNKHWTLKERFVSGSIFNPNESLKIDDPFPCINVDYNADLDDENYSEEAMMISSTVSKSFSKTLVTKSKLMKKLTKERGRFTCTLKLQATARKTFTMIHPNMELSKSTNPQMGNPIPSCGMV